jgi:hypothetical protein
MPMLCTAEIVPVDFQRLSHPAPFAIKPDEIPTQLNDYLVELSYFKCPKGALLCHQSAALEFKADH